jgi:hypothetical protein
MPVDHDYARDSFGISEALAAHDDHYINSIWE